MIYRILVFEDKDEHFAQIKAALETAAGGTNIEIVRFTDGFQLPQKFEIHPIGDGDVRPQKFPPATESDQPGYYYQSDFDAAILDQYIEGTDQNWGEQYLKWLQSARFPGPISIVSQRHQQQDHEPRIRCFTKFTERANGNETHHKHWARLAADHALMDRKPKLLPDQERLRRVNYKGRNPEHFIAGNNGLFAVRKEKRLPQWRQIYFGDDEELDKQLSRFFVLPSTQIKRPIDNLAAALIASNERQDAVLRQQLQNAHVYWFDCGDELNDGNFEHIQSVVEAVSTPCIAVILAEKKMMTDDGRLAILGAKWVRRSIMADTNDASRACWAADEVSRLAQLLQQLDQTVGSKSSPVGQWPEDAFRVAGQMVEALIAPRLLARNNNILSKGNPSLASWIDESLTATINTSFSNRIGEILDNLMAKRLITERQYRVLKKNKNKAIP